MTELLLILGIKYILARITLHIKMRSWKLVSQQYRAWLNCTDVQAGLVLYWCQRLIIFGSSRIRVNNHQLRVYITDDTKIIDCCVFCFCFICLLLASLLLLIHLSAGIIQDLDGSILQYFYCSYIY